MNNLKFRVWSKRDNALYYPEKFSGLFAMNIGGDVLMFNPKTKQFEYLGENGENEQDYIFEQFTGLKDKNGKEIYCGDIVEVIDYKRNSDSYDWRLGKIPQFFPVEFNAEQYEGSYSPFSGAFDGEYGHREYEAKNTRIVGNIHENPELLAKCKNV